MIARLDALPAWTVQLGQEIQGVDGTASRRTFGYGSSVRAR